jgi:hypothetical protein
MFWLKNKLTSRFLKHLIYLHCVSGHGMMIGPIDCNTGQILGMVRNYQAISYNIDSLRNPSTSLCRGASPNKPIDINSDSKICIALAISNGAKHVGPCSLEFRSTSNEIIKIGVYEQCVKSAPQVSCNVPNLVTGDMCRYDISFDKALPPSSGYLRWNWIAQHIGPPYEEYENCVDVNINRGNSSTSTIQPTNAQTTNSQTTNTQTTNSQTTNSQTTNTQTTNSQTTNSQTTNAQTTNSQTTNSQTTNSQTTNSQTTCFVTCVPKKKIKWWYS